MLSQILKYFPIFFILSLVLAPTQAPAVNATDAVLTPTLTDPTVSSQGIVQNFYFNQSA